MECVSLWLTKQQRDQDRTVDDDLHRIRLGYRGAPDSSYMSSSSKS